MNVDILGYIGLTLVFTSFIVRRWVWLYTFNMLGAIILATYAYLIGNLVFTVLEAGLSFYLLLRLLEVLRGRGGKCLEA